MSGVRKTLALLIIIFIGVPVLLVVIWAVGVTRAVVSPEFLAEMPRDIIARVPNLLEETLEAVDREDVIADADTRAWVRAAANAETPPKELLEKIGVMDWLENKLSQSLEDIGKIVRGDLSPRPVMLDMRPLKAALTHEGISRYLHEILEKLPPCTDNQTREWLEAVADERPFEYDTPPACQPPDLVRAVQLLRQAWAQEVEEIPDEVDIFDLEREDFLPRRGVNITHLVVSLTYFLFLIPAVLLLVSALIATSSGSGILRWIGVPTLIGGALAFGLSHLIGKMIQWGVNIGPFGYSFPDVRHVPFSEAGEIFIEKLGDIILVVVDHLFAAVNTVAGTVCVVGIVLIALSYLVSRESRSTGGGGSAGASGGTGGSGGAGSSGSGGGTGKANSGNIDDSSAAGSTAQPRVTPANSPALESKPSSALQQPPKPPQLNP
jgi:uncharacterized membrane protein YgcG